MKKLFFLCIPLYAYAGGTSIVYNFRIAQVTKEPIATERSDNRNLIVTLFFDQYNKKYSDAANHYTGGLLAYSYTINSYFFRADGALARIHSKDPYGITILSETEPDDVLITIGKQFTFDHNKDVSLSILSGIPTHPIYFLQHAEFGFGQFSLGGQIDGKVPITINNEFIYGVRYVRFFQRSAQDRAGIDYTYSNGNLQDILVSFSNNWNPHGLEIGYSTRFQFGASVFPSFGDILDRTEYIRSNIYAVYKYKFKIGHTNNRFLVNFAYSRDHLPKYHGNRYVLQGWISWNINF